MTMTELRRCPATSRRTGQQCGQILPEGWVVCRWHGGLTPRIVAKAEERLEEAQLQADLRRLGVPLEVDPAEALLASVYEAAGNVAYLRMRVQELGEDELTGMVSKGQYGGEKHEPNVLVRMYDAERDRLADVSSVALRAGIDERRVKLAERTADRLTAIVTTALDAADLTPTQHEAVRRVLSVELRGAIGS